jgi:nitroreductase
MATEIFEAIRRRRSIKRFTARPVSREEITRLLDLAVLAPNHRMTEPWSFLVLGPLTKRAYGEIKGRSRAAKVEDPGAAQAVLEKTVSGMEAVPAVVAFVQSVSADAEVREEDYAAVYMGIQNFLIGATASGLGTHVRTGGGLDSAETRAALGVVEGERIVALVEVGEEGEPPREKPRTSASERTRWLP